MRKLTTVLLLVSGAAGLCHAQNLETKQKKVSIKLREKSNQSANPLIIINGQKQILNSDSILNANNHNIKSITVLKDEEAVAKYGAEGKNGVILIDTKSGIDEIVNNHFKDHNEPIFANINGISIRAQKQNAGSISLKKLDPDKRPLYVVDGKEMTQEETETVDPNSIKSVEVLKSASAITLHGDKGKNGVIIITTKNSKNK
ncbi:TonB-dependent receptor plug domain-containing protein [Pedobacter sp.]|uniref:TonB-dependent receptor plug domain-containing protein n=1 Tax=Pedobacter sp. TaxID=1411316 RepID=UPI003BA8819D